jgi:hypothetical protein
MMRFLSVSLLLCGMAVPARAADLATIGCVDTKLDSIARAQALADVTHNLGVVGQRSAYSPSVVTAMREAAAACAKDNGWSPEAERSAALYTLAKISLPVVQQAVSERGLDPSALEAVWLTLPEDHRNKPLVTEDYRYLADSSIPEGPMRTRENGALMRTFFEFESIIQYSSYDFSQA